MVIEEVQAREEELEEAKRNGDPTTLWIVHSAAAEKGMLTLISDHQMRSTTGGRGRRKTAEYRQIVPVEKAETISEGLSEKVRAPTGLNAALTKAGGR